MERLMASLFLVREEQVLLLYREGGTVVNHLWVAACGGHMEKEELNNAKATVIREMQEEMGLLESDVGEMQLRYITLRNAGGEIRQNYYFFARLETDRLLSSNEGQLKWCSREEALALPMPISAKAVITHYFTQGWLNDSLYGVITDGQETHFTQMNP